MRLRWKLLILLLVVALVPCVVMTVFANRLTYRRGREIGELGHAFNEMIPQLQDRLEMRHALALAMEVQQHLLPRESPRVAGMRSMRP